MCSRVDCLLVKRVCNMFTSTLTSKIFGRFIFRTKMASENIIVQTLKRPNNLTVRKFNCPEMSEILILPKF